ncbi:MAG: tRNA (adenosine(37)-N6)-threonylcarbamoyltransferase complex ATPase subunit type 1 TsaE [Candidatus Omnitrophica bacterium]|nr:tRNA (adenosine(37)-N6)-threonylcarbamoyltransferase complex ATPase subunit type 1 TsaE [Candidatus Omnitrophota bacterium]
MSHRQSPIVNRQFEAVTASVEETHALGEQLGRLLQPGDVVALRGELGSGKTTLIQGIAKGLGCDPHRVKSPTFVLMREYSGPAPVVHIDGYRLSGAPAAAWLDVDLMFSPSKITLIEWAERFEGVLPSDHVEISLAHVSTNRRRITFRGTGARGQAVMSQFQVPGSRFQVVAKAEPET